MGGNVVWSFGSQAPPAGDGLVGLFQPDCIRVGLVCPSPILREGLSLLLQAENHFRVEWSVHDWAEVPTLSRVEVAVCTTPPARSPSLTCYSIPVVDPRPARSCVSMWPAWLITARDRAR